MITVKLKLPDKVFWQKLLILGGVIVASVSYVSQRYHIGFDSQLDRCIPNYQLYLIDKWNKLPTRNGFYAFRAHNLEPMYQNGTIMLKQLTGLPGDEVIVTEDLVLINHEPISYGLNLAEKLGLQPRHFSRHLVIEPLEYWFSGISDTSFDSRYFGAVKAEYLIGRAIPIW